MKMPDISIRLYPIKGDLPSGPCEWEWDKEDRVFYTSCNNSFSMIADYCPECQGQVFIWEED